MPSELWALLASAAAVIEEQIFAYAIDIRGDRHGHLKRCCRVTTSADPYSSDRRSAKLARSPMTSLAGTGLLYKYP
jgi:hypothetical protein